METNVDGQIEFGVSAADEKDLAAIGWALYPMAVASGEMVCSRLNTYIVQKDRVIMNSIGRMIDVRCICSAYWLVINWLGRGEGMCLL